jgi:hypothetical protein
MKTINLAGFDFIKIGTAERCGTGVKVKQRKKEYQWHLALNLIHDDFADAEQSTYLVYVEDELVYVGEYTSSFAERWLKQRKYFWHSENVDDKVNDHVKNGKKVSVWISVNPYLDGPNGEMINVNKAIEQRIIEQYLPPWNKRGKGVINNKKTYKKVIDIIKSLD